MEHFDKKKIDQHLTVLYVEDQKDILEEFVDILSLYVDRVITATNGEEGLKQYQEHLPDIIITDIQMPIMDGLEMIKKVRANDKEIPIIVTTAYNESSYLLDAITLGIKYYLLKPVMMEQLQDRLESVKKQIMQKRELDAYHLYLEERIEEEIALRQAKESLLIQQNKAAEVGEMVRIIAHQWKQPLHYLHLLVEDLGMEFSYQPLTREYIDDFMSKGIEQIDFLGETMDNFLAFYKSGKKESTFRALDVVKGVAAFLSVPFKAYGIEIHIDTKEPFVLRGRENELQQIILNLINNAKDALIGLKKEGARITITLDKEDDDGIITVEDNGGGIAPEIMDQIFKMEFTTKEDGNGIGLYLVKRVVTQRFNGEISVDNIDEGACFTLRLPLLQGTSDV